MAKRKEDNTLNNQALLDKMAEKGFSIQKMYTALGMSRSAFYRKRTGKSEFTLAEMNQILSILHVKDPREIFFK